MSTADAIACSRITPDKKMYVAGPYYEASSLRPRLPHSPGLTYVTINRAHSRVLGGTVRPSRTITTSATHFRVVIPDPFYQPTTLSRSKSCSPARIAAMSAFHSYSGRVPSLVCNKPSRTTARTLRQCLLCHQDRMARRSMYLRRCQRGSRMSPL